MTLAVVILLSASLVAAGFCLVIAVKTINDMCVLCKRLNCMLARVKEYEDRRRMEDLRSHIAGDAFKPATTTLHFKLIDEDEPLDFPNA